jgi:catechol 2,3-dioxygenase-like lactoylglutathione lyase family enzyme
MEATGVNHIILTIGDVERSRAFYRDVLGCEVADIADNPDYGFYFAVGEVEFYVGPSRQPVAGDRFSEFRIGLDHVAFTVADRPTLDALAERLLAAGVDTKGVEQFAPSGNYYIAFRDPDNIQLEFWLP